MPTIDIPGKICSHCGGTEWYTHNGRFWCSVSRKNARNISYKKENKELRNEKRKKTPSYKRQLLSKKEERRKYRELNPIVKKNRLSTAERSARHYLKYKNSDVFKQKNVARSTIWNRKQINELGDHYIKFRLRSKTNLSAKDIPQDLIILKRKQLLLKRKIS